jgi:hypothetical protein
MKKFEKQLLNHLQQDEISNDVPLKNVRQGLGSVAYAVGNPATKTEISLQVSLFYTAAGVQVFPAALPAALQTSIPVYLFGLTDFYGGYFKSRLITPQIPTWVYTGSVIVGYNTMIGFGVPGANIFPGDLLTQYVEPGGITASIIVHCNNIAYGTFLNSFVSDLITIDSIRYIVPIANVNQFINPVIISQQTLFGKVNSDSIDPRMYITSRDFQQQISDLPMNLPIDKSIMIGLQMDVFCPAFSWVLFVKKVESLTHKQ